MGVVAVVDVGVHLEVNVEIVMMLCKFLKSIYRQLHFQEIGTKKLCLDKAGIVVLLLESKWHFANGLLTGSWANRDFMSFLLFIYFMPVKITFSPPMPTCQCAVEKPRHSDSGVVPSATSINVFGVRWSRLTLGRATSSLEQRRGKDRTLFVCTQQQH